MLDQLNEEWTFRRAALRLCIASSDVHEQRFGVWLENVYAGRSAALEGVDAAAGKRVDRFLKAAKSKGITLHESLAAIEWIWFAYSACRSAIRIHFRRQLASWLLTECSEGKGLPIALRSQHAEDQRGKSVDLLDQQITRGIPISVLLLQAYKRYSNHRQWRVRTDVDDRRPRAKPAPPSSQKESEHGAETRSSGGRSSTRSSTGCERLLEAALNQLAKQRGSLVQKTTNARGVSKRFHTATLKRQQVLVLIDRLPSTYSGGLREYALGTRLRSLSNLIACRRGPKPKC